MPDGTQGAIAALGSRAFKVGERLKRLNAQLRAAGDVVAAPLSEAEPEFVLTEGQATCDLNYAIGQIEKLLDRTEWHANRLHMP